MSYNVSNGDVLEVSFKGTYQGQRFLTILHYAVDTGATPSDGPTMISDFDAAFNLAGAGNAMQRYANCLNANANIEQVVYQFIALTRRARVAKIPAVGLGQVIGTDAPPNIACALTKQSDTAGRHGYGTVHMPALVNESFTGGTMNAGGLAVYGGFLSELFRVYTLGGGRSLIPVIFRRTDPANSVSVLRSIAQDTVRTMHRRTVGVGE